MLSVHVASILLNVCYHLLVLRLQLCPYEAELGECPFTER